MQFIAAFESQLTLVGVQSLRGVWPVKITTSNKRLPLRKGAWPRCFACDRGHAPTAGSGTQGAPPSEPLPGGGDRCGGTPGLHSDSDSHATLRAGLWERAFVGICLVSHYSRPSTQKRGKMRTIQGDHVQHCPMGPVSALPAGPRLGTRGEQGVPRRRAPVAACPQEQQGTACRAGRCLPAVCT